MKPVRLKVSGFTAFRQPTEVEFEGRRLFVITGPTGAGKSSLLDAMMWALYGQVPRVGKSIKELISQGEREASVLLEFTVRGRRYQVSRRQRVTDNATNTTVRLERMVKDQWVPEADRVTEVAAKIQAILGMDYTTFTRSIVLPQGEFDLFLRGDKKERRKILGQLMRLEKYEQARLIAKDRSNVSKASAEAIRVQLEHLRFATPDQVEVLRKEIAGLEAEEQTLTARRVALVAVREQAAEERERRAAHEAAARAAEEAAKGLAAARTALQQHTKRAEDGRAAVQAAVAQQAALAYDREQHDRLKAQVALLEQREAAERALASAREEVEASRRAVVVTTQAQQAAAGALAAAQAEAKAAGQGEAAATKDLAATSGRALRARTQAEEALGALEQRATEAEAQARGLEQRARDLDALSTAAATATADAERATAHATRTAADAEAAREAAAAGTVARDAAAAAVEAARAALDEARVEDAAAAIRAGLKQGDPCPVCGEPIATLAKHQPGNLERAQAALTEAERALAVARTRAEETASQAASASARVEAADQAKAEADARVAALEQQALELGAALAGLAAAQREARTQAEAATGAVTTVRAEAAARRDSLQALRDALARVPDGIEAREAARGTAGPEDVRAALQAYREASDAAATATAAAQEAERASRDAQREVQDAERDVTRAQKACTEAEQRLAALGGVQGDPAAIRQALADADALAQRVEAAAEAVRVAREALASAEASALAAASEAEREQERVALREAECATTQAALQEAREALGQAWRQTVGAETAVSHEALKMVMERHREDEDRVRDGLVQRRMQVEQAEAQVEQAVRMRAEVEREQAAAELANAVATELQGNRFIAFLLQESMQILATDASDRLSQFTNGRYSLVAEEDEFLVVDRLNGDEKRSVKTLSGGETFLASLALALALSEHLPEISGSGGAVSLDSLFLDEGFGALDAEALDLAVQGLETLAEGSRMVGVISHVEELADRLPDRLRVEKGVQGSTIVV
ncbi:MAG: SMC family ATPase [Dehalococcoidia bacterium]|nr:SMC family ATPase [Dehalococcoidia bacterium]